MSSILGGLSGESSPLSPRIQQQIALLKAQQSPGTGRIFSAPEETIQGQKGKRGLFQRILRHRDPLSDFFRFNPATTVPFHVIVGALASLESQLDHLSN